MNQPSESPHCCPICGKACAQKLSELEELRRSPFYVADPVWDPKNELPKILLAEVHGNVVK